MSKPKYLGVTPPVDTSQSSEEEEALANDLLSILKSEGQFESEEERKNREVVLGKIDKMVKEFVYRASLKHKLPESLASACGGKIFTFGSYRLGVHGAGADIDTLCVVPSHVTRDDFFDIMVGMLKERSEVTEITPVPKTYVPVIKMQFSGVDIDLTVAVLQQPTIPEDLELFDNNILRTMNSTCVRSLNGSRVTDEILRLVPNIATFRLALRCIKLWAKRRAIYSNPMGFFGGVAWAMVVARICQLYPNKCASTIVTRFFHVLSRWRWPTPVLLKEIESGPAHFQVWNPRLDRGDRDHRMPIITPAYPSMCATHNVSQSTKQIIEMEVKRGLIIVDKVMQHETTWRDLFEKDEFFRRYKFYLQVNVSSTDGDVQHGLHGFLESRVRQYVTRLETTGQFVLIHPYIKSYDHDFVCKSDEEAQRIRAGFLPVQQEAPALVPDEKSINVPTPAVPEADQDNMEESSDSESKDRDGKAEKDDSNSSGDTGKIYTSAFYLGLLLTERDRSPAGKRRMDLSLPTQEFIRLVKESTVWDDETMTISIRFLRQEQLPDEVFGGMSRERLHYLSSSKKRSIRKASKKNNESSLSDKPTKKSRTDDTAAPSTTGIVVSTMPKQNLSEQDGGNPTAQENTAKDSDNGVLVANDAIKSDEQPTTIPAPVPLPTRSGGIRLKLLGS
ncbi:Poly(A) polymerase [Coemansia reversa NRRL 1564]|uniref:Poly(A) polymerase n=1 Tax=Coemansia reversa (strain ATCC 12441 / NRRL 1564) TaxID=763665 RepID=A0A2G5BGA0_COERN|nr:Poly(A) polymerase [Coemansia reversa NRRL 1564]|eukprot:PIA18054.1 Poly(A) polymerase [Coemansia reversa NRRL 1564]